MKTPTFTILTAALVLAGGYSAAAQGPQGVLRLLNDDSLPGRLHGFDAGNVIWDSPKLEQPAPFLTEKIRDIRMPAGIRKSEPDADHEATLTLTNGDELRGRLFLITDDEVTLATWYAGRLVFRRVMVRKLAIRDMADYVFRGPGAIEDWTQTGDGSAWKIDDDNALVSTAAGGIARDVSLPDEFTLEFEARSQKAFRLHLILFSDDPPSVSPENGYEVVFQRSSVHIRRCGVRQWLGHSNRAIELQRNDKAHIRIQASARTGQFAFYMNDHIIDVWNDPEIHASSLGSAIHFISRDESPLVISRIDVSKWDGIIDELVRVGNVAVEDAVEDPELPILLRNGERIHGVVKSIQDDMIHLETQSLPFDKVRTVGFDATDLEEPKREHGDIRAWFADGGSIVFRPERITDDGKAVQGHSQTFGTASFDLSAFNRIEFNIYDLFRESR